jgi:hypothetical protein
MIILDGGLKSLEVVLTGTVVIELPVCASYVDVLNLDLSVTGYLSSDAQTAGLTPVAVVGAPAAGHTRTIKLLTVRNSNVLPAGVVVRLNNNGTIRILWGGTLDPGDTLQYEG